MKEAKYEEWLYKGCRSIIGVTDERVLTALYLIRETRRELGEDANRIYSHEAYSAMFRQCDRWRLDNPFTDPNAFYEVFRMADGIEDVDWETMLVLDES